MKCNKDVTKWEVKGYSDSDFAGDTDERKSISGYVIYLQECPISWRSKSQKSVSLSSTEAEYMAVSEIATEILFIKSMLEFLGVKVELPIEVNVDNVGAIYLSKSAMTSNRTRHIDMRYHFVQEYIDDGILKVVFVKSEDNHTDIMTTNFINSPLWQAQQCHYEWRLTTSQRGRVLRSTEYASKVFVLEKK